MDDTEQKPDKYWLMTVQEVEAAMLSVRHQIRHAVLTRSFEYGNMAKLKSDHDALHVILMEIVQ